MTGLRRTILVCAGLAAIAALWLLLGPYLKFETFLDHREAINQLVQRWFVVAMALYFLVYCVVVVLSLPVATVLTVIGGVLFGTLAGAGVTVLAATCGATLVFLAARSLLHGYFERKAGPWLGRIRQEFQAEATSYLLFMRLAPVFPFVVVNIASALLGSRLKPFVWTTLVGIIPGTIAYTLVGSGLGGVLDAKADKLRACRASGLADCRVTLDPATLLSRDVILALGSLALLVLISIVVRRVVAVRRGRQPAQ